VIFLELESQHLPNEFLGYAFLCEDCFHSLKALMPKKPITKDIILRYPHPLQALMLKKPFTRLKFKHVLMAFFRAVDSWNGAAHKFFKV
jgi:hypothetical protein